MLEINDHVRIPEEEFSWKFARSGGPGGQNVNKVASKSTLIWDVAQSAHLPEVAKIRLALLHKRFFTTEGVMMVMSQKFRDQDRNRQDCLDKLRSLILEALTIPKPRRATKPTKGSKKRRLEAKKHRSSVKSTRKNIPDEK